jgi:hypothetical protein
MELMANKRLLHPRGQRLTQIVLATLLVVAAVLAVGQKWPGVWWWVSIVAAGLATVVTGAGSLWQRWREQEAATAVKVLRSVQGTRGPASDRLPTTSEVDLRTLRVHPAVIDLPYLHRTAKEKDAEAPYCAPTGAFGRFVHGRQNPTSSCRSP